MRLNEIRQLLLEMPLLSTLIYKHKKVGQIYLHLSGGTGRQEHPPMHIHVVRQSDGIDIPVDLETLKPVSGEATKGKLSAGMWKIVRRWIKVNKPELTVAWERAQQTKNPRLAPNKNNDHIIRKVKFKPWDYKMKKGKA